MKSSTIAIITGLLAAVGILLVVFVVKPLGGGNKTEPSPSPATVKTGLINTLAQEKRPYIIIEPKSTIEPQSLGHWATFTIYDSKGFQKTDYEFEYKTPTMIQGGMGHVDLVKETPPVSKQVEFGSESKGKYKYDEGVYEGTFTFTLTSGSDEETLKTNFTLTRNSADGLVSNDGKVKITAPVSDLSTDFVMVASTLGLPEPTTGKVLSGPYGFYADSQRKLKNSTISFEDQSNDNAKIMYWNNSKWQELETTVSQGKAQADIPSLGTFVLVQK